MSGWATLTGVQILGLTRPPPDVTGFLVRPIDFLARLVWEPVTEPGLSHYVIRHSPATSGAVWGSALVLDAHAIGTSVQVPALVGTYLIKAVTLAGVESVNAAVAVSTVAGLRSINIIDTYQADPAWTGTHLHTEVVAGVLRLAAEGTIADWPAIDTITAAHWTSQFPWPYGEFIAPPIDLGEVFSSRVSAVIDAAGDNINGSIANWGPIALVGAIAGDNADAWRVEMAIRVTDDDPAGTPVWSDWVPFQAGDYSYRAVQPRLRLYSLGADVTPVVFGWQLATDMPDRLISGDSITIASAGMRVAFVPPFRIFGNVAVSFGVQAAGVRILVTNADPTGFDVTAIDASGAFVAGQVFSYIARGAGKVG